MKLYIIAGEASGDLHAANLMKALKDQNKNLDFRCWGGDLMEEQGAVLVRHYRDLAFMGFVEVVKNLPTIMRNIKFCKKDILNYRPDAIILVDYPGFNLRIAEFAHEQGIRVIYYISPQVWAWKKSRVFKIKKFVDLMIVILPFEKDFYKKYDYEVAFVGHPLLDVIDGSRVAQSDQPGKIIALLPGSRKQEISRMLPIMVKVAVKFKDYNFEIARAPGIEDSFYKPYISGENIRLFKGHAHDLLIKSHAALVTSGTATLETSLLKVPEVVCYKGNAISYTIAKNIVDIRHISLVNLIMGKDVVKELIQNELTTENLVIELQNILDPEIRSNMMKDYSELRNKLGGKGASDKTAKLILDFLEQNGKILV